MNPGLRDTEVLVCSALPSCSWMAGNEHPSTGALKPSQVVS